MVKNGERNKPFWELSYTLIYIFGNLSYTSQREAVQRTASLWEATKRSMRKRVKQKKPVYSSGTGAKENILCYSSQSRQDKNALFWEKIQNECRKLGN